MARDDIRGWANRHPVASFFTLAYAISWLGWLPAVLGYRGDLDQILSMIAQFGPAVAALVLAWYSGASVRAWARQIVRWRVAPRWYAIVLGVPVLLIGVQSVVLGLLGTPLDESLIFADLFGFIPTVIVLTLIAGLGEEPGWRGFALPRLENRYSPVVASLVLGGIWATWHLPLVFVDPRAPHGFTSLAPLVLMFLLTLLTIVFYAFIYTWVYNATHSVLLCMILHGAFNTATGLVPAPFETLQRWVYVTLLVVQNVTLLVAVAVLVVATGGMLAYKTRPGGNSEAKTLAFEMERSS
jgi:membrane protease YdiL (CAAX protease family)